ncbi:MAG: Ig-like domain-containing protein [Thermoplasmata archaeon]|nr:MAG: Ig-like domain-containing protein [Thermoplasmata archaeon]
MERGRVRVTLALLIALLAVGAALYPVFANPNGAEEKNWGLCNNTEACHGLPGSNTSLANVTAWTPDLTVYAGQPNITVLVNVTGAEQYEGDPIGVSILSNLENPLLSPVQRWGWVIQQDPRGRSPGFDYSKMPALGVTGNTSASFTWLLQAPPVPGNHTIMIRMQTGVDHLNGEFDTNPISRDVFDALPFRVVPPPEVLDATPRNGTEDVFINSPVVIAFNKEMDRPSVEGAFSIDPPVDGTFTWEGPVARFNPDDLLDEATTYTYRLDTTAFDMDGIQLLEPLEVAFTTGSDQDFYPPVILSILSSRAPRDAVVRITFSEPMDRASVINATSIDPDVAGNLSWEEDTLVFTPHGLLDYDTLYTVRVDASARDLAGNPMGTDVFSTFLTIADTVPPEVHSTSPKNRSTDVPLVTTVSLTLSDDVDRDTLPGALSWQPPVLADISWEGSTATLTPGHPLEEGVTYNLTVGTSLMDVRGNPMEEPYLLVFSTAGSSDRTPPYLVSAAPPAGSNLAPGGQVRLTWSEAMDRTSVEEAIWVSPMATASFSWSGNVLTVTLEGTELGRVYTVNVDATLEDLAGNTALEPYALRYVAAPDPEADRPVFYIEDWLETWWDLALLVSAIALVAVLAVVQVRWGWGRVALTAFAWVEERVRSARYLTEARRLYYSIDRQMPHTHAERYGAKTVWYWYPFYCLGGIAILCFVVLGVTGLVLSLYYVPSSEGDPSAAYRSVETIMEDVSFGFMFRAIHHWAANIMIAAVFLHMLRVFFTGAYRNPRELNWVVGSILLVLTIFYGFSGYLLPWNQLSYWAGTIGLEMARTVPVAGDWFAELIFGGVELGAATLTRMYFFHVLFLPLATITLMVVHLIAVYIQGLAEPH